MKRLMIAIAAGSVLAAYSVSVAEAACNGRTVTRTGPAGKTLTLCLDGKYSTCLRDSKRLGWSEDHSTRHCNRLLNQGRVTR